MIISFCVTHKTTSVPLRESLTFHDQQQVLTSIHSLDFVEECVLLQTCNRIEIHLVTSNLQTPAIVDKITRFWSRTTKVSKDVLLKVVQVFEGREALHHLLLLASGLESMVVGEDQILGQMRKAYFESKEVGTTKSVFDTVFTKALNVGRKVRVQTRVNKGSISVSSIAVDLAEKWLTDPKSSKALIIGAGKTGELAAKELSKRNIGSLFIANRTNDRSVVLAKTVGGQSIGFDEIYDYIPKVNLVIAAVSVPKPILTAEKTKIALQSGNRNSALLLVDLSQPRCIENDVGFLPRVELKTMDDLNGAVSENLQKRLNEAVLAKKIVMNELDHLENLLRKMAAEPIISLLCRRMEKIRQVEFSKALQIINGLDEAQRIIVENLTRELVEKILQTPIENLRNSTLNGERELLFATNILFNLKINKGDKND